MRCSLTEQRWRTRLGFTLIELIVVITVIAILSTLVLPEFHGTRDHERLRTAARQLLQAIRLGGSQAVTSGKICRLRIDVSRARYLLEAPAGEGFGDLTFAPLERVPGYSGKIEGPIGLEVLQSGGEARARFKRSTRRSQRPASPEALQFYPDGTADARDIVLTDTTGQTLVLRVNSTTSRVLLLDKEEMLRYDEALSTERETRRRR